MPHSRLFPLLALVVATLVSLSCRKPEEKPAVTPPGTIVTLGARSLTSDDFTRYLERNTGTTLNQLAPPAASALLDQFIDETLLALAAEESGVQVSKAAVDAGLRNDPNSTPVEKREEMQRLRLLGDVTAKLPPATPEEVASYYQSHQEEFRGGEQVRLRQILVRTQADANAALKDLKAGQTFEAVSTKHSRAPNAARGGEIGLVERGQLPKVFETVVFSLQPGQLSGVVKSDSNLFHIFRVDERRPAGGIPLEQATPLIEQRLKEEKLRQRVESVTAATATAKGVRVLKERLGFAYAGRYLESAE